MTDIVKNREAGYQKCVHREAANAKLFWFQNSVLVHPNQQYISSHEITIKVPKCTKIWDKHLQFFPTSGLFPIC